MKRKKRLIQKCEVDAQNQPIPAQIGSIKESHNFLERKLIKAILILPLLLLILIGNGYSQTNLTLEPGGRNKPGFVYDSARKKIVLFGGFGKRGEGIRGDTWEWDGGKWNQTASDGPAKRGGVGMTYDNHRKKVVLFGGTGDVTFGDTWEWDGKNWKQVAASGPSARAVPQLVYDTRRKKAVLFGGFDNTTKQPLGDTWEWDGSKWSEISSSAPSPRFHHFMVYDSGRGKIVLFGGMRARANPNDSYGERVLGDTWEYDGKQWRKVSDSGPPSRDHHAMSYDDKRGKVVLFGGSMGAAFLGDTWEWDGRQWTEIKSAGPSARGGVPSMAFDSSRKRVILFGGWDAVGMQSDIWHWNGKIWKQMR